MSANPFGYSTQPAENSDFLAVCKYDARFGRVFRVSRQNNGSGFESNKVDITPIFRAVFDLEHAESGMIAFVPGSAPITALTLINHDGETVLPPAPTPSAKRGLRVLVRLNAECAAGEAPVRELMSNAITTLQGLQQLYLAWKEQRAAHPNELPIVILKDTTPIGQSSVSYRPNFEIVAWTKRPPDLIYRPRANTPAVAGASAAVAVQPTQQRVQPAADPNDFG